MAQILIIKSETTKENLQYLGDVVGLYNDNHQFSSTELEKFDVLTINGSVEDVRTRLNQLKPNIQIAYLWESDNEYHWTEDGDINPVEIIDVYQIEGDNKWYKLINDFKFPVNVDGLTAEEKQTLETVDINHPSVDSFIRKLIKDVAALLDNNTEVKELKNTSP